jgi:hypothetical protein
MHDLPALLKVLSRTPSVLHTLLSDLDTQWTHVNYGDGTWSAYEVVGHLIAAELDDWMPRVRRIVAHGNSLAFDPFAHQATTSPSSGRPLHDLLEQFGLLRSTNLRELSAMALTPPDLDRRGLHPALGEVTLRQLLTTWTVHDLHHLRQISLAMAWQARDEVGPWREYLNTLHR